MKKLFAIAVCAVMALSLAACGASKMPDGTYTAEMKNASHDYKDYLTVTYKDGKIVDADFDSKNVETGKLKSETTFEEYPMEYSPSEWMPLIEENVKKASSSKDVDTVAGATWGSESAKTLLKAIEDSKGKTEGTIVVENEAE